MSYQNDMLGAALGWKYNSASGIQTQSGTLTDWPVSLGSAPTDNEQAQAVIDYQTYLGSNTKRDDELTAFLNTNGGKFIKAIVLVGIDKGIWTLNDIRTKYRSI